MFARRFLMVGGFFRIVLGASLTAADPGPVTEDFEGTVPATWRTGSGGGLTIANARFKSGTWSLAWKWDSPAETLTFRDPAIFGKRLPNSAFGLWVHNESPSPAPLRADLLNGEKVVGSCWFWMDFSGWRPLGASYLETGCQPDQVVDAVRLHAPDGVAAGTLHLDCARFNFPLPKPWIARSWQMPWSGTPDGLKHPESVVSSDADIRLNRPWLPARNPADAITAKERADMAKLADRLLPPLVRPAKGINPAILDGLRARMKEYRIERHGMIVTGRPVDGESMLPPPEAIPVWEYLKFCTEVQKAHDQAAQPGEVLELKRMFVDLCSHFLDQGWGMGSLLGGWDNYPGVGPDSFFLMRDVLAEAGLARGMALAMADRFGCQNSCQYLAEHPSASMDGLGFWNNQLMSCVLMLPDEAERLQHVRAVQRYYNLALTHRDTIAPDGCTYHHGGFHYAYASYNLPRLMNVLKKTADTDFRIDSSAHERLRTYVRAIAFTLSAGEQAYNLGMRAGTPLGGDMSGFAADLARMGTPDGKHELDTEMAGLSIWCVQQSGTDVQARLGREPHKSWIAAGIKPLALTGHLTMNGAPIAIHRGDGWLAGIAGMSMSWRGLEIYGWTQTNNHGRFARNGSICLTSSGSPPTLAASGWSRDGWNWSHFPGTTALLRSSRDLFDGYAMYGNASTFAGGTQLGDDGVWAMEFTGGNGVAFNKSYFCFGNRITSVTTGIRPDPKFKATAVTTLFQNSIQPAAERVHIDGESVGTFPMQRTLAGGRDHWLIDNKGTGYHIPAGNDTLRIACRSQEWLYLARKHLIDPKVDPLPTNKDYQNFHALHKDIADVEKHYRPTRGDFALAWFDHGAEAGNASCVYTMLVRTTPGEMTAIAESRPWAILQRDARAHVVSDTPSMTTGYALFMPNENIEAPGDLRANDQPCFVMIRKDGPNLRLSMARTDIRRTDAVRLQLAGGWKPRVDSARVSARRTGDVTLLEIHPDYYMPMRIDLVPSADG